MKPAAMAAHHSTLQSSHPQSSRSEAVKARPNTAPEKVSSARPKKPTSAMSTDSSKIFFSIIPVSYLLMIDKILTNSISTLCIVSTSYAETNGKV